MWVVCLANAAGAATVATSSFTLAWTHSIEKVRWEEHWRVEAQALVLESVQVRGFGAGMEPPPEAVLRNGAWVWHPGTRHTELRLTRSDFTDDYQWCQASSVSTFPPAGQARAAAESARVDSPMGAKADAPQDQAHSSTPHCRPLSAILRSDGDVTLVKPCAAEPGDRAHPDRAVGQGRERRSGAGEG